MITPYENENWSELRNKIIGLGERSQKKSYYPELKRRFNDLEKFKVLLDSSSELIFLIEKDSGKIIDVNETVCYFLQYKKKEIINHSFEGFIKPEIWKNINSIVDNFSETPLKNSIKTFIHKKDNFEIPVELTYSKAEFKESVYIIIVARDITERLRTEEELSNSEINLRTVFNSNRDAMFIHDDLGNVVEVNDQMLSLYEVDRLSFQKYSIKDYSSQTYESAENIEDILTRVLNGEELLFLWKARKPMTNKEFWCEVFLRKILWYGRWMILAVVRDITEKKQTEEALKESEQKYRTLYEKMLDAFCVCEGIYDDDGNFIDVLMLDVNPAYEKMYGLKKEVIQGRRITEFAQRRDDYWFNIYDKVIKTGESVTVENFSSAWEKYYSICAFKFQENQFAIVIEDITSRKKSEMIIESQLRDLEAKNSEMERFTYTVSHDLRSPLITIKGFSGAIREDINSKKFDRIQNDLFRIENAADKMQHLLEDLLELSRIGRIINPPVEFSMTKICNEVKELLHGIIEKKGINFIIDSNMPGAFGDVHRIREVIQNLVENAVKFSDKVENSYIEIGSIIKDDECVYFVKDNGPGIEKQYYEKIFGLFDKLDIQSEGTGIGLAIVKRIIELHGGRIWVESSVNEGAVFYFTIKMKKS